MNGNPHDVAATIRPLAMTPNVPNAVPGHVELVLEVRSDSDVLLDGFPEELKVGWRKIGDVTVERGRSARASRDADGLPGGGDGCDGTFGDEPELCEHAFAERRGHDDVEVAATGPIGMIFIP